MGDTLRLHAPDIAQVAEQQGKYLARQLNKSARAARDGQPPPEWPPFPYHHLGRMALVGESPS